VRRADETRPLAARETPDVAVLIDSWGFTLRVAQRLRRLIPAAAGEVRGAAGLGLAAGRAQTARALVRPAADHPRFDAPLFERRGCRPLRGRRDPGARLRVADPARLRPRSAPAGRSDPAGAAGQPPGEIERVLPAFEDAVNRLKAERPACTSWSRRADRRRPGQGARRRLAAPRARGRGERRSATP
jgi:lipid-A-disaccharide synthase